MDDMTGMLSQRLQTSLNPSIGVPGKDTDPQAMAQFMANNDPQKAAMFAKVIMGVLQQKQMDAQRQRMMQMQQHFTGQGPPMPPAIPQGVQGGN